MSAYDPKRTCSRRRSAKMELGDWCGGVRQIFPFLTKFKMSQRSQRGCIFHVCRISDPAACSPVKGSTKWWMGFASFNCQCEQCGVDLGRVSRRLNPRGGMCVPALQRQCKPGKPSRTEKQLIWLISVFTCHTEKSFKVHSKKFIRNALFVWFLVSTPVGSATSRGRAARSNRTRRSSSWPSVPPGACRLQEIEEKGRAQSTAACDDPSAGNVNSKKTKK